MKTRKKAFTLVELVITLAISGIVIALVSSIFLYSLRLENTNEVKSQLQQDSENIHGILVNIGTQSKGLSSVQISGPVKMQRYLPGTLTISTLDNDKVSNYRHRCDNSPESGYTSITEFTLTLPKGESLDSFSLPGGTMDSNDYIEYRFVRSDTTLKYSIFIEKYSSSTLTYTEHQIKGETVLSNSVDDIKMKALNWQAMTDDDNYLNKMDGAKFIIIMKKQKGFASVDYDASAIVNFRNMNN